jgi:FKBP-type peptidyl-prolyl cis-trans isomerase 2
VSVQYEGTLDDGSVFDSSRREGRSPLEFRIGAGRVIKARAVGERAGGLPRAPGAEAVQKPGGRVQAAGRGACVRVKPGATQLREALRPSAGPTTLSRPWPFPRARRKAAAPCPTKKTQGFDKAVTGLAVGERRKVRLTPEEGYGERSDEAVITVPAGEGGDDAARACELWAGCRASVRGEGGGRRRPLRHFGGGAAGGGGTGRRSGPPRGRRVRARLAPCSGRAAHPAAATAAKPFSPWAARPQAPRSLPLPSRPPRAPPPRPPATPEDRAPPGLKLGDRVSLSNGMAAVVSEVAASGDVTIDLNPELAGARPLLFQR